MLTPRRHYRPARRSMLVRRPRPRESGGVPVAAAGSSQWPVRRAPWTTDRGRKERRISVATPKETHPPPELVPRAERPPPRRRRSRLARLVRASHDDFPRRAATGGGLGRPAGGAPEGQGVAALRAQGSCRHRSRDDIRRRTPGCVPNLASRARRRPPRPPPPPAFPATRAEGFRHRRRPGPPSPPPRAPSRPRASPSDPPHSSILRSSQDLPSSAASTGASRPTRARSSAAPLPSPTASSSTATLTPSSTSR